MSDLVLMDKDGIIAKLLIRLDNLEGRVLELERENIFLKKENTYLRDRLSMFENPKNSRNSSVPPSKDENRPKKNQSLRQKSGKKAGGQPGHKGSTLEMVSDPDRTVDHCPDFCNICGSDLSDIPAEQIMARQIVDIPPIIPEYTEHRIFQRKCTCGHQCRGSFPENVKAPISYGPNVRAAVAYLHTRQYLPVGRTAEFFRDFCGLPLSPGSICNLLEDFAKRAMPAYDLIHQRIRATKVAGSDETGIKVDGKKGWFWTWQNPLATYIVFSENRGIATIDRNFPLGLKNTVLVHDCWTSHFRTPCRTHQLCTAHLLRELVYFIERYRSQWAMDLRELLLRSLKLKKELDPDRYDDADPDRDPIIEKLQALLASPLPVDRKDLRAFHKRMIKYRDYIFTFLHHPEVPPDNNASERAIRNVKVKQKVSGQFKTPAGAQGYAIVRSVTDTCIKNGQNVLDAFKTIAILPPV